MAATDEHNGMPGKFHNKFLDAAVDQCHHWHLLNIQLAGLEQSFVTMLEKMDELIRVTEENK